jgi:hypothetical protein
MFLKWKFPDVPEIIVGRHSQDLFLSLTIVHVVPPLSIICTSTLASSLHHGGSGNFTGAPWLVQLILVGGWLLMPSVLLPR